MSVYGWGTLSASVPRWLVIYAWAGVALVLAPLLIRRVRLDAIDWSALAFLGYATLSYVWAADPLQAFYSLINMWALGIVFFAVRHTKIGFYPEAALVGVSIAMLCQVLWPFDYGGHGNSLFQATYIVIACVFGLTTTTHKWPAVLVCLPALGYALTSTGSKVGWLVVVVLFIWWACSRKVWSARFRRGLSYGSIRSSLG